MKKVLIIGGGLAGLTAGIQLQKAGLETEIFEKNPLPGGNCTGWTRKGYHIDNCLHFLVGTKPGSQTNKLWHDIGVLGDGIGIYEKQTMFSYSMGDQKVTFYRDLEKTRQELLAISPEDKKQINRLVRYTRLAEKLGFPSKKPISKMNLFELIKFGWKLIPFGLVALKYSHVSVEDYANKFKSELIRNAIKSYIVKDYKAYCFFVSYSSVTAGNGDIPEGGSLKMALRIAKKYKDVGGKLHTNVSVDRVLIESNKATGIKLADGTEINADYVICATDLHHTFNKFVPSEYTPKKIKKLFDDRKNYPTFTEFQLAYAIDGVYDELKGFNIWPIEPLKVGEGTRDFMDLEYNDYDEKFAPEGKMIVQSAYIQTEADFEYWKQLHNDREAYLAEKNRIAEESVKLIVKQYPYLEGKIEVLDTWSPMTYAKWCNCYKGSFMSFMATKKGHNDIIPGVIKKLKNVFVASQWLMSSGGLPIAASMGNYAAYRIIQLEKKS